MPASLDTALMLLGQEVPLGRVDRELKKLWDSDEGKTRASLMNFAIYTECMDDLERNVKLLDQITAEHSCRALLILCQPGGETARARAWINALCRPYQGKQVVCSEQISFVLESGNAAQVQNIVFAHLDSDLPLVVWWQGDLTSNFEERFYSGIDRLFIDSSQWCKPVAEFAMLDAAFNGETSDFEVHDLSWTRSHYLRSALAGCFQDEVALRELPRVNRMEITYAKGHRVAALLLASWVAMRLHCTLNEKADGIVFTKPSGGSIELALNESVEGCPLQRLALTGPGLCASARRDEQMPFIHTAIGCGAHERAEMLPADAESEADLISSQLSRAHGTSLYFEMVPMLRRLLRR